MTLHGVEPYLSCTQVDLPDAVSRRCYHTLTAVSSGPTSVQIAEFGGQRTLLGDPIAATAVLQLGESLSLLLALCYPSTCFYCMLT